ncbi:hypothetical protein CQ13_33805 [Bradyrhizobium retamae]|uniref:Uncharacterized protein n=1 Tax=Bradyrhizobium retamae TaxID=1300035 RepID=A0A0R3MQQ4_9BRAD|nr:hypothetical protein CQ13_33805 [Bradyrhizobium retamae]
MSERPEVHCIVEGQSIAFAIHDLVVPELITCVHGPASTRFVLPLSPAKAAVTIAKARLTLEQAGARCSFTTCFARAQCSTGMNEVPRILRKARLVLGSGVDHTI